MVPCSTTDVRHNPQILPRSTKNVLHTATIVPRNTTEAPRNTTDLPHNAIILARNREIQRQYGIQGVAPKEVQAERSETKKAMRVHSTASTRKC